MRRALWTAWQAFWSVDALLFVLAYTALILVAPVPKTKFLWSIDSQRGRNS